MNTEIKLNRTKEWTKEVSDKAKETKKDALALLNEVNNLIIPEIDIPHLKEKAKNIRLEAQRLKNETDRIIAENEQLVTEIEEQLFVGHDQLDKGKSQEDDTNELLQEIYLYKTQAEAAVRMGNDILNSTKETYKILTRKHLRTQRPPKTVFVFRLRQANPR